MKFLLDENLSHRHAARLRANGHDAVAVVEESLAGASDSAVRSAAAKSGRVLPTLDADFGNIVRYPPKGTPGIIGLRLHPPSETKIEQAIDRCLDKLGKEDLAGKLAVRMKTRFRCADSIFREIFVDLERHAPISSGRATAPSRASSAAQASAASRSASVHPG